VSDETRSIAAALTEAARTINQPRSLEETLDAIVQATMQTVPGFNHVGISVARPDGSFETKAGTDQLVWELDDLQYSLDEGPCVQAMREHSVVLAEHIRHDQRWPQYVPSAVKHGLRAQLAMGLHQEGRSLGGLNLYSTETDEAPEEAADVAEMFAAHAAIALGHAQDRENLGEAVTSRQLIGQATGLIMQRYGIDETRAFDFLVRAASTAERKVRVIAQEVVDGANEKFTGSAGAG
jgi:GAF domain-containing protein